MSSAVGSAEFLADQPLCAPEVTFSRVSEPPVDNRRFFVETVVKPGGPAPLDKLTGVPLLLSPSYMRQLPHSSEWDDNHVMFSRRRPELMDYLGLALRRSRVQHVHPVAHRPHFHTYYSQPVIGQDDESRIQTLVVHVADYVPDMTLRFSTKRGQLTVAKEALHRRARNRLIASGEIRVYDHYELSKNLGRHLFAKYIAELPEESQYKLAVGNGDAADIAEDLLREAVARETTHVDPLYEKLQNLNRISKNLPKTAGGLILKFMQKHGLGSAYDAYIDYRNPQPQGGEAA